MEIDACGIGLFERAERSHLRCHWVNIFGRRGSLFLSLNQAGCHGFHRIHVHQPLSQKPNWGATTPPRGARRAARPRLGPPAPPPVSSGRPLSISSGRRMSRADPAEAIPQPPPALPPPPPSPWGRTQQTRSPDGRKPRPCLQLISSALFLDPPSRPGLPAWLTLSFAPSGPLSRSLSLTRSLAR